MARTNGPIQVWHRTDTIPTDAEGGYAGGDSTAAAVGTSLAQSGQAVATIDNLTATATTRPPGSPATVTVTGPVPNKIINIGVPRGEPGQDGMGYAEGLELTQRAEAAETSASSAATRAENAEAAKLEIPDANTAAMIGNPLTETRAALEASFRQGAALFAVNYPTLQASLDAMPDSGGVLQLEAKDYVVSTRPVVKAGTVLRGANSALRSGASGGTATRILYTGAEGPALTSSGSRWGAENLTIAYNHPNFTGTVVEGGATLGSPSIYRSHVIFRNVWIGSLVNGSEARPAGGYPATSCVDLHGAQNIFFDNCHFFGAQYNIDGVRVGVTEWAHAIAVNFRNCTFHRHDQWAVRNPHFSWSFDNCTFERNEAHVGRALVVEDGLATLPVGCHFNNCWFGDNTEPGDWIEWRGHGLVLTAGRAVNIGAMVKLLSGSVTLVGVTATPVGSGRALVDATEASSGATVTIIGGQPGSAGSMLKGDVYPTNYFVQGASAYVEAHRINAGGGSLNAPGIGFGAAAGMVYSTAKDRFSLVHGGDEHIRMQPGYTFLLQNVRHFGSRLGFYGAPAVERPSLPDASSVTAADIRAALIALGLVQ